MQDPLLHGEVYIQVVKSVPPARILIQSVFVNPVILESFLLEARANAVIVKTASIINQLLPVSTVKQASIGLP
jgi:hypothetical protein